VKLREFRVILLVKIRTITFAKTLRQKITRNHKNGGYKARKDLVGWKSQAQKRSIFIDISSLVEFDHGGGIQRVQRSLIHQWRLNPPKNFKVFPIYYSEVENAFLLVKHSLFSEGVPKGNLKIELVEFAPNDIYLNLDLNYNFAINNEDFYRRLRAHNVQIYFFIYDLLPLSMPFAFPDGVSDLHKKWFQVALRNSKLICISESVMHHAKQQGAEYGLAASATNIQLGSDLEKLQVIKPLITATRKTSAELNFLVVSTIEVRKCHEQVLDAFERLWAQGFEVTLTFVGRMGWKVDNLIERIKTHPELGKKFYWLSDLTDGELNDVYLRSCALINASLGEGFGLPLVEASVLGLPLILRDIPVFKEIAGEESWYFESTDSKELAEKISVWIQEYLNGHIGVNTQIKLITWKTTCEQITDIFYSDSLEMETESWN